MDRPYFVLACGGHGRVVLDTLLASGEQVEGVLDPALRTGDQLFGVPVLGGDDHVETLDAKEVLLANGLGANPEVDARRELFTSMTDKGFSFGVVQHPSASIGRGCQVDEGAQVFAGTVLQSGVLLGRNAVINTRASVDHDCRIAAHAFISPGVVLCGEVRVGESAFVGAGAVVLPGVSIGGGAIVGAGAIVTRDVADNARVAGNPATSVDRTR